MAKNKWYQSRAIQAAIIGGIFLIVATIVGALINSSRKNRMPLSVQQNPPLSSKIETQLNPEKELKTDTSLLKLSAKQLSDLLKKYPNRIQAEETYDKFYRGSLVEWKGIVHEPRKRWDGYEIIFLDNDKIGIFGKFDERWGKRIGPLIKGDTLWILGRLGDFISATTFVLDSCIILDK